MAIDEGKLEAFMGSAVVDLGAAISTALTVIGDKLGLYRAMDGAGPLTPAELAERTGTAERYVREWLSNQAAGGYVTFDPQAGTFTLPDEQAFALAQDDSPVFLGGFAQVVLSIYRDLPKVIDAFRTGAGVGWHDTTTSCSTAPSASSVLATPPTSRRRGSPRSRASRTSCGPARGSPTWGAGTARPPSCSRRPTPPRHSPASTTTRSPSTRRARPRLKRV